MIFPRNIQMFIICDHLTLKIYNIMLSISLYLTKFCSKKLILDMNTLSNEYSKFICIQININIFS